MKKVWTRIVALVLIVSVWLPFVHMQQTEAAENQAQTVKVGIFNLGKFMYFDEDGEAKGYNVDYLNKVAESTHWNYEFVKCNNWVDATEKLERGEIELLAPAQKTDALMEEFDYSAIQMGIECAAIYTLDTRENLAYEDFDTFSDLKFGAVSPSTFTAKFEEEYAEEAGFKPNITYYSNTTELLNALYANEVEAVVTNIMFADEDLKILGSFSIMPVYFITQKGNTKLLDQLDSGLSDVMVNSPNFQTDLINHYFPIYNNTQYTYEERGFADRQNTINIGFVSDKRPLSYADENGEFIGIGRDILDAIADNAGLDFHYIRIDENDSKEQIMAKGIYFVAGINVDREDENIVTSKSFLETERVFVSPRTISVSKENNLTLAVAYEDVTYEMSIKEEYPNFKLVRYDCVEACFEAIKDGEADMLIENRYVVEPYLSKPKYENFNVMTLQGSTDTMCLEGLDTAGNRVNTTMVMSMVDKGINNITEHDINAIIISNTSKNSYQYTLTDFVYKYFAMISMVVVMFGMLCAFSIHKMRAGQLLEHTNKELAKAVSQAEKANMAKSQFLAQMSHEIRTPMNAIIGFTSIAKTEIDNQEKVSEYLSKINTSSKILLGIINDVLDMSAIESKKVKIAKKPFDLKSVISTVTNVYYEQSKQKGIHFNVHIQAVDEEKLLGDELRTNQILMNLLSNAIKFTPSLEKIDFSVIQTSRQNKKVCFRFIVADTGVGMSEELKTRLFQPFEQESASTAHKHGGSGLGLSITKNLVDLMGGSIGVESTKGQGSVFTVDLPFEVDENAVEECSIDLTDIKTLVVDDDENTREYLKNMLEKMKVPCEFCTNGQSALEKLGDAEDQGIPFKLCLIDWQMPNMDGVELTKNIRDIFQEDAIIIMISAYDLNEIESKGKAAGADYFIQKPVFQSTMFDSIVRIAAREKGEIFNQKSVSTASQEYDFSGKRVLVAEDVVMNMEVAVKILSMVNIEVECAEDGKQALDFYRKNKAGYYDAILMDINMPIMDGYEAVKKIRAAGKQDAQTIPIYAMTANAFTEDVTAALDAGMNGHIAKPIETKVLYKTLEKAFDLNKTEV